MLRIGRFVSAAALAGAAAIVAVEPAFAGTVVPAPLLGAGLPALGLFAAGYYVIRKIRH